MGRHLTILPAVLVLALVGTLAPATGHAAGVRDVQQSGTDTSVSATSAGCGALHKVGVVLKLGIAVGLFHRYLYKPWKQGKFKKGASGRKATIVKAAIATLVGVLAARSALKSMQKCGAGQKLAAKLNDAKARLMSLKSNGGGTGSVDGALGALNGDFSTISALKGNP